MSLCYGLGVLGLLIGTLVGMSSDNLSKILLGLAFGIFGGSIVAFIQKVHRDDRNVVGAIIFSFSLGCFIGLYSGILVSEYELLTPRKLRYAKRMNDLAAGGKPVSDHIEKATLPANKPYVRSLDASTLDMIFEGYEHHYYSKEEAKSRIMEAFNGEKEPQQ